MITETYNGVYMEGIELEKVEDAFLFFVNIRSSQFHIEQLKHFIEVFSAIPLVTALYKTWLTDKEPTLRYKTVDFFLK